MKLVYMTGIAAIMTLTTACSGSGGSSNSVDQSGNCTSDFVMDYNAVSHEAQMLKLKIDGYKPSDAEILAQGRKMKGACDKFMKAHSGISCKAEVEYRTQTISSNDHKQRCDLITSALEKASGGVPESSEKSTTENQSGDKKSEADSKIVEL